MLVLHDVDFLICIKFVRCFTWYLVVKMLCKKCLFDAKNFLLRRRKYISEKRERVGLVYI